MIKEHLSQLAGACFAVLTALFVSLVPGRASAKWYIVAGTLPNNLELADTTTNKVVKTVPLDGQGPVLWIATSSARPDYSYAATNGDRAIAVVNWKEGKQVATYKLGNQGEIVRIEAINLNPKGDRLYVCDLPLKKSLDRYVNENPRFEIIDVNSNRIIKTFAAPQQVMSFAFSPDGSKLYAFSIGQDVSVLDSETGRRLGSIPLANRNITGIRATYGLPLMANYQEQNYLLSFAVVVEDSITGQDTLGLATIDLKEKSPVVRIAELEPFVEDWYTAGGIGTSRETHKAFFVWNDLWKVDYKTRKREAEVTLPNSQAAPLVGPNGKLVYCGGQWHSISVYDASSLKHVAEIELQHSMAGISYRFVDIPNL